MHGLYHYPAPRKTTFRACTAFVALVALTVRADFKDDIDYTKLKSEYGATLPTGQGIRIAQIEATRDGAWATSSTGELAGRSFTFMSSVDGIYSPHAYNVGAYLGGSATSITPGVDNWPCFESSYYIIRSLFTGRLFDPAASTWDVENHSWGGTDGLGAVISLQKMDFRIDRDNVVAVVALDNESTLSELMANAYNVISVGSSTGNHPHSGSTVDGVGRMKPDLVGTATFTSYATPIVSSSATLLLGEIKRSPTLAAARSSMVVKALLMAGATKDQFPGWTNTPDRPLDVIYGTGQVNIYNSYKALIAGQQAPISGKPVATNGWDANIASSAGRRYFFSVPAGKRLTLSAVLAWNRHVVPGTYWFTSTTSLTNLDLVLWNATSGYSKVSKIAQSVSTVDNVEHIFQKSLPPGIYALEVVAPADGEKYGLAWKGALVDDASVPPPVSAPPSFATLYSASDIGGVGSAGSSTLNSSTGAFRVTGAGTDIAGLRDAFQYAASPVTGDFEIVTKVTSFSASHGGAKAGLMLRENATANAAQASILVTPIKSVVFARRLRAGTGTSLTTVQAVPLPVMLKLRRSGNTVSAYYSSDGSTWASLGSSEMTMSSASLIGLAVTSKISSSLATAQFDTTSLATGISSDSIAGLSLFDVGASKIAGNASLNSSSGVITVIGAGYCFPRATKEGCAYLAKRGPGDGAISTIVLPAGPGALPVRAGLMMRDTVSEDSAQVSLALDNSGAVVFEHRSSAGAPVTSIVVPTTARRLILDRRGTTFTAMFSSDGVNWTKIGTTTVYLRTDANIGLVTTSANPTSSVSADFDGFDWAP